MKTNFLAKANVVAFTKEDLDGVINCKDQELSEWAKAIASVHDSSDPNSQPDLLLMRSILVSEGMNLNDDIFLREELMNAKSTGAHKPVNIEHQDENIVGHMLNTYAINKDGQLIEGSELPSEKIDIVNEAVIYSYIFPQLANDIQDLALTNGLFVSVEAWFETYDYSVGSSIVEFNEQTALALDKVLRINGGDGYYNGKKVGRVLRGIRFGGVGIVATPANPESLILDAGDAVNPKAKEVTSPEAAIASSVIGELDFSVEPKEADKVEIFEEIEGNIMEKSENNNQNNATNPIVGRLFAMLEEVDGAISDLDSKIVVLESNSVSASRQYQLCKAGLTITKVRSRKERIDSMSEQDFNDYLSDVSDLVRASEDTQEESVDAVEEVQEESSSIEPLVEDAVEAPEAEIAESEVEETTEDTPEAEATEEVAEVEEVAEEVESTEEEEVSAEDAETEATEEESPEAKEEATPEVLTEEAVETPEVAEDSAPEAEAIIEPEQAVEDSAEEEIAEVDLENIEPVSPELAIPSAETPNDYKSQLEKAIIDILSKKKS